jgi:mono/diheme cytochrome c family protein
MKRAVLMSVALLSFASIAARAADADVEAGKQLFARKCAECHAPGFGHPGTQQLGWTRGDKGAVLEARTDLVPAYIAAIVRNGLFEMPAFRPTEITDEQLKQLGAYLSKSPATTKPRKR